MSVDHPDTSSRSCFVLVMCTEDSMVRPLGTMNVSTRLQCGVMWVVVGERQRVRHESACVAL